MTNYASQGKQPLPAHKILARRVRLLRIMRRWSQETLAELAGLHRTYIGAVERAERNPCLANIEKIAGALEVPVRQLLDERFEDLFGRDRVEEPRTIYLIHGSGTACTRPRCELQQAA